MKKVPLLVFTAIFFCAKLFAQMNLVGNVQYFNSLPNIQIRALQAVSETKAWFAANHGVWGYTENAGKTWHIDSIKADTVYPQFRSIAVLDDSTLLLLSIASPAYLFKTTNKGKNWRMVFKDTSRNIFFDCMTFTDSKNGFALADPINNCFQIIKTSDGGETWKNVDCSNITEAQKGEGCFAASNSNVSVSGKHVWFVSGGLHTRVFHSSDGGNHFEAVNCPLPEGEQMTGIFSVAFFDEKTGVIAGGNYVKADTSIVSLAITYDGGLTWSPIKSNKPVFGSCIQFRNADEFYVTGMTGTFKCNMKSGEVAEVKDKSGAVLKFHTLRFSPDGKALWLAGSNGSIAVIKLN